MFLSIINLCSRAWTIRTLRYGWQDLCSYYTLNIQAVGLMVSEIFSHYKSMETLGLKDGGHFGPQGLDWHYLYMGSINVATN